MVSGKKIHGEIYQFITVIVSSGKVQLFNFLRGFYFIKVIFLLWL